MKDRTDFGYYLVAFVDLLGQADALKQFGRLPNPKDPDEMNKFTTAVKNTFGLLYGFHDSFQKFFDTYSNRNESFQLTDDQKKLYDQMGSNQIQFQRFSDGLLVFLSLRDEENKAHMRGVSGVLFSCAAMFLLWLSKGHPMRAGIEIGIAAEMHEGEIYGPAVADAHKLESVVAQYPRLVLGDGLLAYFNAIKQSPDDDVFSRANKLMVAQAESMVLLDDDGYPIIDYLGSTFKAVTRPTIVSPAVSGAYEFVMKQSAKWQSERNTKLAFRYTHLRNYFESRLPLWKDVG
jgi:hypothetical protein